MTIRTTVNVDDDVLFAVRATAKASHSSVGAVLSDWARHGWQQALDGFDAPSEAREHPPPTRNGIALLPKLDVIDDTLARVSVA